MPEENSRRWSPPEDIVQGLEYLTKLSGKGWLIPGSSGALSIKTQQQSVYGESEEILWMASSSGEVTAGRFTPLHLADLRRMLDLEHLAAPDLANELYRARAKASDPLPPWECLLHACFPERCVIHACPPALLALTCSKDRKNRLEELFGASIKMLEFAPPGFPIARLLARSMLDATHPYRAVYLVGYGLLCTGADASACFTIIENLETQAQSYLLERNAWSIELPQPAWKQESAWKRLALIRKDLSDRLGYPVILNQDLGFWDERLAADPEDKSLSSLGPPVLYHAHPCIVTDDEFGVCSAGTTAADAFQTAQIIKNTYQTYMRAELSGGYRALTLQDISESDLRPTQTLDMPQALFSGEIGLVTGGASGIGKACVESLLRRGAAVVNLDINPAVVRLYERPDYLGILCDLTDERAVIRAFETLTRRFGGLDMLVLNAGIFPAGTRIEDLDLSTWQKVMQINLDHNLVVLREAHPLLRYSPKCGRVLVNASKNVLAPGAGAAAYSSAKAAVTQLARVAALEWAKDRIRINMIHPHAVLDTGIWTEEVLQARAAHYGMSVQQYKTNNLLGVELTSHYIGELAAEMLGPLFENITGAQIPVDGGSDRVI